MPNHFRLIWIWLSDLSNIFTMPLDLIISFSFQRLSVQILIGTSLIWKVKCFTLHFTIDLYKFYCNLASCTWIHSMIKKLMVNWSRIYSLQKPSYGFYKQSDISQVFAQIDCLLHFNSHIHLVSHIENLEIVDVECIFTLKKNKGHKRVHEYTSKTTNWNQIFNRNVNLGDKFEKNINIKPFDMLSCFLSSWMKLFKYCTFDINMKWNECLGSEFGFLCIRN